MVQFRRAAPGAGALRPVGGAEGEGGHFLVPSLGKAPESRLTQQDLTCGWMSASRGPSRSAVKKKKKVR